MSAPSGDPIADGVKRWAWLMPAVIALVSGAVSSFLVAREQLTALNLRLGAVERMIEQHSSLRAHPGVSEMIEARTMIFDAHAENDARLFVDIQRRMDRAEDRILDLERDHNVLKKSGSKAVPASNPKPTIAEVPQ